MSERHVLVRIPASTANLGPGFDTLGMALSLYAWLEMSISQSGETTFDLHGMDGVPRDKSNLIYKVAQLVFEEAGVVIPELHIAMYSEIPLTRGLGSSASAIVGALTAANALIGNVLSNDRLFQIATQLEGHPDNVGASLFGGIVVSAWDGKRAEHVRLEPPQELDVLVAIPNFQLSTEKARHALPTEISMKDAVFNVCNSSLLVAAFASGRLDLIRHAMRDRLHQPYRAALIPGMAAILDQACEHGALGAALSGAGPTLLAFSAASSTSKPQLESFLQDTLLSEGITSTIQWLRPDLQGPQVTVREQHDGLSFMDRIKGEIVS
ncbi:homoserine kinase [Paenibacillus phyllosphaerae]|uniref:Homoserine kinase n=1 Tax=Paenibacillus phyllosphaerae TaxID=274593 RepID=A0A7W5FM49_9BACL|nr:homoserine kinase [Paenibacillus phyllosphaerae]MBB3109915.1 homoserine kinase [Paenibacillus phyllosphaerae]